MQYAAYPTGYSSWNLRKIARNMPNAVILLDARDRLKIEATGCLKSVEIGRFGGIRPELIIDPLFHFLSLVLVHFQYQKKI